MNNRILNTILIVILAIFIIFNVLLQREIKKQEQVIDRLTCGLDSANVVCQAYHDAIMPTLNKALDLKRFQDSVIFSK